MVQGQLAVRAKRETFQVDIGASMKQCVSARRPRAMTVAERGR